MKHSMICLFVIVSLINVLVAKNGYRVYIERASVTHVNKEYMEADVWMVRLSRYNLALSGYVNVLTDLSLDTVVNIKCFEFRNNEYRPSILDIKRDLCNFLKNEYTYFLPAFRKTDSHVPDPKCPVPKENYTFVNYSVSNAELPIGLPFNKVRVNVIFSVKDLKLLEIETYGYFDHDKAIRERFT